MRAVNFRAAFLLVILACNGSDVTNPSTGGLRVTPAPSGSAGALLTLTGRIAFVRNAEIYLMKADGSGVTRLTNNPASDGQPAWSPNGTKIAFVSNRAGNDEIYVMNPNGTGVTRLTNNAAADEGPAWSPSGTKIAFSSNRAGHPEIYVMNANGTGVTRLTNNLTSTCTHRPFCLFERAPAWSSDGAKIAFLHRAGDFGFTTIDVMNADGSGVKALIGAALPLKLVWSRLGRLAYDPVWSGNHEIFSVRADGTGRTQLTNNSKIDEYPTWSPDGTSLAFESDRDGDFEVYAMNANGTGVTRRTNNSVFDGEPAWGP